MSKKYVEEVIRWMHMHVVAVVHWISLRNVWSTVNLFWYIRAITIVKKDHIRRDWWRIKTASSISLKSRDHEFRWESQWTKIATACICFHVITSFTYFSGPEIIPVCRLCSIYSHMIWWLISYKVISYIIYRRSYRSLHLSL